jgi:hypothetical protein
MYNSIKQYLPALGMVAATLLSSLWVALGDNVISASEWFVVTASGLGAFATYIVPRVSEGLPWLKIAVSGVTAAVVAAGAAFASNGISGQEWMMIGTQLLVGLGIVVGTGKQVPITPPAEPYAVRRQASG